MNEIILSKDKIINPFDSVLISKKEERLVIEVMSNSDITFKLVNDNYEMVTIIINPNSKVNMFEISDQGIEKKDYEYKVLDNSFLIINKLNYMNIYQEKVNASLDGINSHLYLNVSMMSKNIHKYLIDINHNNKNTTSIINNHGVTTGAGLIEMTINGRVQKGMIDSVINQDNKIMMMGTGRSIIKPNLYIDENMVEARHGASIGRFNDDEIFYMKTRGIDEVQGYNLLMKGFLLGILAIDEETKEECSNIIDKYRR